jgi:hypothetical protein
MPMSPDPGTLVIDPGSPTGRPQTFTEDLDPAVSGSGAIDRRSESTHGIQLGGTAFFSEDFAAGNFAKFGAIQNNPSGGHHDEPGDYDQSSYHLRVVHAGGDRGNVVRFEIRNGDTAGASTTERNELVFPRSCRVVEGDVRWYQFDVRLGDPTWSKPTAWEVMWQWHQAGDSGSPPIELGPHPDGTVKLSQDGLSPAPRATTLWTIRPGTWERVTMLVTFSNDPAVGSIQAWVNDVEVFPKTFRRTMLDSSNYLKCGLYRKGSHTNTQVLMYGNLKVSGSGTVPDGGGGDPQLSTPVYAAKFADGTPFPLFTEPAGNTDVPVANSAELLSKVGSAAPGQTLVLANGTYSPGMLTVAKKGTRTQPIVIRALNPGQVKLASGSGFKLTGEWILVKDIDKEFDDAGKSFSFEGSARFCGYDGILVGPTTLGSPQPDAAKSLHYYAGGDAADCFFTFCESRNKSRPGNGFLVDGNFSTKRACSRILIDHPYIHDYGTEVVNDFEAIRYGVSTMQTTRADAAVIRGVFRNIATEPEIISIKANNVESWGHTVENCVGSLSIRHGDNNFHRDCYVIGPATGASGKKAGGARVYGKNNDVSFCHFEDLNGSGFESTLTIDGGDTSSPTNDHQNVVGGTFTNNVGVNCATAIVIGEHFGTAPKDITVSGNRFVHCGGQAVRTVKAPTGTNHIADNVHHSSVAEAQSAGMTGPTGGAFRFAGRGPRLVRLAASDVGRHGNRADGTGAAVAGSGGGPDPGTGTDPGPSSSTIAGLLKLGSGAGLSKFDIGVGFAPGDDRGPKGDGANAVDDAIHRNYSLARIDAGLSIPGYYELTADRTRARLSAHLDGGRTSPRTDYARVEWREYDIDGTTKMAFNPNKGRHYIIHRFAVRRMPPNKPQLVVVQYHDAEDDTAMIRYRNRTTVEAKLGDEVLGNLTTSAALDTVYTAMIEIEPGTGGNSGKCRLHYYWQDMSDPVFTTGYDDRSAGWYGKAGNYAQSNTEFDAVEKGPFIVETLGIGHWHSKSPKSASAWPEPRGLKP